MLEKSESSKPTRKNEVAEVPIWEKVNLTLQEAAELYNIGINRLREITDSEKCSFVLFVGNKRLIKRKQFDEYLAHTYSI